jgi:hypothetical protein
LTLPQHLAVGAVGYPHYFVRATLIPVDHLSLSG